MENNEKIRNVLRHEITWLMGFVIIITSIIYSYAKMENKLEQYIQSDVSRSAYNLEKINKNSTDIKALCDKVETTNLKLERVITQLEKK